MKTKCNVGLPILLMVVFALSRWPGLMPENFSAAYALAFCAGVYFPGRMAWWLPMCALLATDVCLNFFHYGHGDSGGSSSTTAMLLYMLPNYLAYGALFWMGKRFTARASWLSLLCGGLLGAVIFYFVTNTGAWIQNPEYTKTWAGWIQALTIGTAGWPHTWEFFRSTLLSGGLFTGLFVGAMKFAEAHEPEEVEEPEAAPDEAAPDESHA